MRRRNFIAGFASTAVAWPFAARAQQSPMPVIGFLHSASPEPFAQFVAAFREGLKDAGFVEGQNVTTAGPTVSMIDCRRWRVIWSNVR